jgi:hypothetical protein
MKCVLWSVLLDFNWCILLVFKNMERNKTHRKNNIKFTDDQQAKVTYNFNNTKENFVGPTQLFGIKNVPDMMCVL